MTATGTDTVHDRVQRGLARLFVARPILAIVLNLLVVIAGFAALSAVDVREMPDVDQPVISVRTTYEGAAPAIVDQEVTQVLEDALHSLDGIASISAVSSTGSSRVTIDLADGTDIDVAANEAREIVSETVRSLPEDIDDPIVTKNDSDADPIIRLALLGDASIAEMTEFAEGVLYDRLSEIDGVAEVTVRGAQSNEFRIVATMPSLLARGLTFENLADMLESLRDDTPLGDVENTAQSITVRPASPVITTETIGQLPLDATTRIGDVALVQFVPEDADSAARVNGEISVAIEITRQSVGNTLTISREVNAALDEIRPAIPEGVDLIVTSDDGIYIAASITEVARSIGLATLIVVLVIFLFLRSPRGTLIPAVTIPIALIGTVAAIWLSGFSINTISLLALVLATGMVVDDAIVVTENIVRKRREGMGPLSAAVAGANEVFFAVVSTTATLAAVFVPISFLPGQAGGVFSEFGYVLAFSVTISSATALSLVPAMAALLDPGTPRAVGIQRPGHERSPLARSFDRAVDGAIRAPLVVLATAIGFAVIAAGSFTDLSSAITPDEDRGFFLIAARGANDATLAAMQDEVAEIDVRLSPYLETGEIAATQSLIGRGGTNNAFIVVRLADWAERERPQAALMAELGTVLSDIPGVTVSTRSPNSLNIRGGGRGLQFAVIGNDINEVTAAARTLVDVMSTDETFVNPQLSAEVVEAQMQVEVDADMAKLLDLDPAEVIETVGDMIGGREATSVFLDDTEVTLRIVPGGVPSIDDPTDLESIFVATDAGQFVPLSAAAALSTVVDPTSISREGGALAVTVQVNLGEGIELGEAVQTMQAIAAETLPSGTATTLLGEAAALNESESGMALVFGAAMLVVFLVLAAQFESFASAAVIMLTVPFGLAAAVMAIQLSGGSLNYYSQIGMVMLIGVMAKNGILIVEFANQLRAAGQDIDGAIRDAMRLRIRPVMMTMVSTVFGGLPLILSAGGGAEARIAVGWVIVGGLGFATLFTLFLTPVLYRHIAVVGAEPGLADRRLRSEVLGAGGGPVLADLPPVEET